MANDRARRDCTAQAEVVRRRQVAPADLVDVAIARIDRIVGLGKARRGWAKRSAHARSGLPPSLEHGPLVGTGSRTRMDTCGS